MATETSEARSDISSSVWLYNKTVMDFSAVIHDVDMYQKIIIDLGYRLGQ